LEPDPPAKKRYFCFSCDRVLNLIPEEKKTHEHQLRHTLFEDTGNIGKYFEQP
jgi:hypothetical protein